MDGIEIGHIEQWSLAWLFPAAGDFLVLNAKTLINTWIIMGMICCFCIICFIIACVARTTMRYALFILIDRFDQMCTPTIGFFSLKHLSFSTTLFLFILFCNIAPLVPGLEEPTIDLNTTLALGIVVFLYIQYEAIKKQGIVAYVLSYFTPFFLFLPLNVIGKLATVMSMSFRLFGNIFGGALITQIYYGALHKFWLVHLICFIVGVDFLITGFFTVFEGALQAFVFTMLTVTHLGLALQGEGH